MSASLVGSEMCIRDRLQAASIRFKRLQAASSGSKQLQAASSSFERPQPCLLYTSDAADDM
eukprot:15186416-Alexandrium_andersonii.AAC.1